MARSGNGMPRKPATKFPNLRKKMRQAAARTLGKVGPDAKPAADALKNAKNDRNPQVRDAVINALKKI
jgi:HEAT repeat protein